MNLAAINATALNGSAFTVWLGEGVSDLALTGAATPVLADLGRSSPVLALAGAGQGTHAQEARAQADIALGFMGSPSAVYFGLADAVLTLSGAARDQMAVRADADAALAVTGRWGIPRIGRTTDAPAPRLRLVELSPDERRLTVAPEPDLPVHETRTTPIPRERRA